MKRFIILMMVFIVSVLIAQPTITKIEGGRESNADFLPLEEGRVWSFKDMENNINKTLNWNVVAAVEITDPVNRLNKQRAYQTQEKESGDVWYFFLFDGFVCKYSKSITSEYKITRILPNNAVEDYNWISNNTTFIVTDVSDEFVIVEFFDNLNEISGYHKFQRGVGICEIYINDARSVDKVEFMARLDSTTVNMGVLAKQEELLRSVSVESKVENLTKSEVDVTESEKSFDVEKESMSMNAPSKELAIKKEIKNDELSSVVSIDFLAPEFFYIQVGSFLVKDNAYKSNLKLREQGFDCVLMEGADGYYKVMIRGNSGLKELIDRVKLEISPGAFVKKRVEGN